MSCTLMHLISYYSAFICCTCRALVRKQLTDAALLAEADEGRAMTQSTVAVEAAEGVALQDGLTVCGQVEACNLWGCNKSFCSFGHLYLCIHTSDCPAQLIHKY